MATGTGIASVDAATAASRETWSEWPSASPIVPSGFPTESARTPQPITTPAGTPTVAKANKARAICAGPWARPSRTAADGRVTPRRTARIRRCARACRTTRRMATAINTVDVAAAIVRSNSDR